MKNLFPNYKAIYIISILSLVSIGSIFPALHQENAPTQAKLRVLKSIFGGESASSYRLLWRRLQGEHNADIDYAYKKFQTRWAAKDPHAHTAVAALLGIDLNRCSKISRRRNAKLFLEKAFEASPEVLQECIKSVHDCAQLLAHKTALARSVRMKQRHQNKSLSSFSFSIGENQIHEWTRENALESSRNNLLTISNSKFTWIDQTDKVTQKTVTEEHTASVKVVLPSETNKPNATRGFSIDHLLD